MNRRLSVMLAALLIAISPAGASGSNSRPIRVFVEGSPVAFSDQHPIIDNGRTLVPIRGVFEAIGATVTWEPTFKRATVKHTGNQVAVFIGSRTAWVNGRQHVLDVVPRILGGRTMVPLRFIAESIGLRVEWEPRHRAVVIGMWPAIPALAPFADPNMEMPCVLRIQSNPMGSREPERDGPLNPRPVDLADYVADVLAHEFGDMTDLTGALREFDQETLKAGAVAILMYAWYYAWHPANGAYDLENSRDHQVYIPGKAGAKHRAAVKAVWGTIMIREGSHSVFPPQYGQGRYREAGGGSDTMYQLNALYLSKEKGYRWDQLLRYFYPNITIRRHASPCAGPD